LKELPAIIAGNTYQTPRPGSDDGHPGVDFAFYSHGTHKTMLGLPVKSAMAGRVAAVIPDRKPYGNTVIIEVPLDQVPQEWLTTLVWPTPAPTVMIDPRLTCPSSLILPKWNTSKQSLYILYGHLNKYSPLLVGENVSCGQPLGEVGTTGASVNPHLHFEARLGPSGAAITSFGHYDAHTTAEERNNYCLWRVSGWFQLIDPLKILSQQP
jgi:murein DD-endopeptidase MepM/ murein hydrolase activator NlpD